MKRIVSYIALCGLPLLAQSGRIAFGTVTYNGLGFYWEMRVEPATPPVSSLQMMGAFTPKDGWISRYIADRTTRTYFGYDVMIEPVNESFRLTFRPLQRSVELAKLLKSNDWTGSALQVPPPQTIRPGDVVALDLMKNSSTGQKVVDYITVQEPPREEGFRMIGRADRQFVFTPGPAHDFTVQDAALRISEPRISVNGTRVPEFSSEAVAFGPAAWIFLRDRGRFVFSLVPRPELRFQKAGEVRGTTLTFTLGGETITISSADRIAPGDDPFNLYVYHDPNWKPDYPASFALGAEPRPETLIRPPVRVK